MHTSPFPSPLPIRLLTHNIRYATPSPFRGEECWPIRAPRLISELRFHTRSLPSSFILLQEVLHTQLSDILAAFPLHSYIGVGRDDGKEKGEYSPIFYRQDVWELMWWKTYWLSETPEVPSKGWDASSIRILTVGRFMHKKDRREVVVMNTHLDDQGSKSRLEAAKMIESVAENVGLDVLDGTRVDSCPVVLGGDFNSEEEEEAYRYIVDETRFVDVQGSVEKRERYGCESTFTGFEGKEGKRIDFVFVKKRNDNYDTKGVVNGVGKRKVWEVEGYAVLENKFEDGVYSSDHRAVVADLLLH